MSRLFGCVRFSALYKGTNGNLFFSLLSLAKCGVVLVAEKSGSGAAALHVTALHIMQDSMSWRHGFAKNRSVVNSLRAQEGIEGYIDVG
jgi:hypothetical protein